MRANADYGYRVISRYSPTLSGVQFVSYPNTQNSVCGLHSRYTSYTVYTNNIALFISLLLPRSSIYPSRLLPPPLSLSVDIVHYSLTREHVTHNQYRALSAAVCCTSQRCVVDSGQRAAAFLVVCVLFICI